MKMELADARYLDAIGRFTKANGRGPTLNELARELGISRQAAMRVCGRLAATGQVRQIPPASPQWPTVQVIEGPSA